MGRMKDKAQNPGKGEVFSTLHRKAPLTALDSFRSTLTLDGTIALIELDH